MSQEKSATLPWLTSNEPDVRRQVIAGIVFYVAHTADGKWNTGPCPNETVATGRLRLYETGHPVSEAAPDMLSRRQLGSLVRWQVDYPTQNPVIDLTTLEHALAGSVNDPPWVWASTLAVQRWSEVPREVKNAGGVRVQRGPDGLPIQVAAAGFPSLTREA